MAVPFEAHQRISASSSEATSNMKHSLSRKINEEGPRPPKLTAKKDRALRSSRRRRTAPSEATSNVKYNLSRQIGKGGRRPPKLLAKEGELKRS